MSKPGKKTVISPLVQIKEIEGDPKLLELTAKYLPPNYDFEIGKTIWRIRKIPGCTKVALQMPEGLLIFATRLAKILNEMTGVESILLGDVTYGACCIDDFTASLLGAHLLVHYGHSCLVPTTVANRLETIYVFVTIKFNIEDAASSIQFLLKEKFQPDHNNYKPTDIPTGAAVRSGKIELEEELCENVKNVIVNQQKTVKVSLVSTIQFANGLPAIKTLLEAGSTPESGLSISVNIPRSKPLSSGEILGCTAPKVKDDIVIYVGDGRFHLEAMMMANPQLEAYRYDPYNKALTLELFDHEALHASRSKAIEPFNTTSKRMINLPNGHQKEKLNIGIILGTLGRQGNPKPMNHVYERLSKEHNCFTVLMSEVMPDKLALFKDVDIWVQFACPRLSIDWGDAYSVPILTPYEAIWAVENRGEKAYEGHPMDYYAYESMGPHTPNYVKAKS